MLRYFRSILVVMFSLAALSAAATIAPAAPLAPLAPLAGPGSPIVIASTPGDSKDPAVAYGNGITHVVWIEAGWIMYSQNSGLSWTTPVSITDCQPYETQLTPGLAKRFTGVDITGAGTPSVDAPDGKGKTVEPKATR